jgi:hypothetical protein
MVWHDVIATLLLWLIFLYLFVSHSIVFGKAIYLVAQEHPGVAIETECARRGMTVEEALAACSFKVGTVSIDDTRGPSARGAGLGA